MEGIYPGLGCQQLAKAYGRTRGASVFGLHDASKINQREGDLGTPGTGLKTLTAKKQLPPSGLQLTEKPENGGMKPFSDNKCS